jgi:hypothetical protein
MEAKDSVLVEHLNLLRNNVTGADTTRLMPKVFQPFSTETQAVEIPRRIEALTLHKANSMNEIQMKA